MADDNNLNNNDLQQEENTNLEPTQDIQDQQPELETPKNDNSVLRQMRQALKEANRQAREATKKLEAIEREKSEKDKTLEEKLAQEKQRAEELERKNQETLRRYELEKSLLQANVNSELLDLMLSKGVNSDDDVDVIVDELKQSYPSAFQEEKAKPQPIGKVGVSQTTSVSASMTKEEVQRKLLDPNTAITPELSKLADEYGL